MNYHNITYPDMNNGDGLRVVLWLSGCSHNCYKCQNPQTHDPNSGILFDENAEEELFRELSKGYISGLTLTGGDPLHENNLDGVLKIVNRFRPSFPNKSIWLYTGYELNLQTEYISVDDFWNDEYEKHYHFTTNPKDNNISDLKRSMIISKCNIVVDGRYIDSQRNPSKKWAGSDNQRVIDIQQSLLTNNMILYCN